MQRGKTMEKENERARLERVYAGKSDLELAELLESADSLTDEAWSALEVELTKRGMELPPNRPVGQPKKEERKVSGPLVMVRRFRDLPDAFVAKSVLDSAEIDSFLADENMIRIDWFISNLLGGVKLMVRPEDAETAAALLDEAAIVPIAAPESETGEKSE